MRRFKSAAQAQRFLTETSKKTYVIRIPLSRSYKNLEVVYLMHRNDFGKYSTLQDIPIAPGFIK